MGRSPALILRLKHPLIHYEKAMAAPSRKESPNASDQVNHMQGHQIRTSEHTSEIWLQEIRPRKCPLSWRNGDEQIREGAQPYPLGSRNVNSITERGPQNEIIKKETSLMVHPPIFVQSRKCVMHSNKSSGAHSALRLLV